MSYTKKTWHDGDIITAAGLNNMETGIKNADNAVAAATPFDVNFQVAYTEGEYTATTDADFSAALSAVQEKKNIRAFVRMGSDDESLMSFETITNNGSANYALIFYLIVNMSGSLVYFRLVWTADGSSVETKTLS
jgi:hypothetical protein